MSVTLTLATEFAELLIRRHGNRLAGQGFWNLLIARLGEVEQAYEALPKAEAETEQSVGVISKEGS